MIKIVPTITAKDPDEYARQLARLDFAPRIHIDITDGDFTPSKTVNLNQIYWDDDKIIDLHLMIRRPIDWLHQIVALAPNLVVLHAESDNADANFYKIVEHLHKFNIKVGFAILPETSIDDIIGQVIDIQDLVRVADHILIFGGHLGYHGGTADLSQLAKTARIREINPNAEIAWDGGANIENVAEIATAGIDVINVGSAIMKNPEPEKIYKELIAKIF